MPARDIVGWCNWVKALNVWSWSWTRHMVWNFIYLFSESRREGEKEGEKHQCVRETWIGCLFLLHDLGPGLQPRHVTWQRIELATFWFAGQCSIHWATQAREKYGLIHSDWSHFTPEETGLACPSHSYSPVVPYLISVIQMYLFTFSRSGDMFALSGEFRRSMSGTQKPTSLLRFALVLGMKPKRRRKRDESHLFHWLI